jgi:hypothetical protein
MSFPAGTAWAQTTKPSDNPPQDDSQLAKQFCTSPAFKQLKCGFASEAEQTATLKNQCALCGTLFRVFPEKLPAEMTGVDRYNQWAVRPISLACNGPFVVRSVFKVLEEPPLPAGAGPNCTSTSLVHVDESPAYGRNASRIVRCELEPPSSGGSETERALNSKEARCWICGRCTEGKGCPNRKGVWYSDSYITAGQGCGLHQQKGYIMHRAGLNINPATKVLVAKFEVCNTPGCLNAKAEQAKLNSAKSCDKGKCA